MLMEALDRESFEFRAEFFGRTIEQELVGCLDGPRGDEARGQLMTLAERRRVRIDELIRSVERVEPPSIERPPATVYNDGMCPICMDEDVAHLRALTCGHLICVDCHHTLKLRGRSVCSVCRGVACNTFSLETPMRRYSS